MSLHLEIRWQDEEGRWSSTFKRIPCADGLFELSPGEAITVEMARQWARASSHIQLERRPYALRIGFSR